MKNSNSTSNELHRQITEICNHIVGPYPISAVCQSDDYTIEVPSAKSTIEVLIVIRGFPPKFMTYVQAIDGRNLVFFAVDQWIFERDVDRGFLGEALASNLIFPYTSLANGDYLQRQEVALKKRLILELLENMVLSYPELSHDLRINPEYFMYEVMLNRVRVFPPMAYSASRFLCGDADKKKVALVLRGYLEALKQLQKEGTVLFSEGYFRISPAFISAGKNPKVRFINFSKNAPRTLFTSLFNAFPQLLNFLSQNTEAFFKFQTPPWKREFDIAECFVDPQKYVFVPTAQGLATLADKGDIRAFAMKVLSEKDCDRIKVEKFGGLLNDVFLIKSYKKGVEKKILVKRFKDWSGFKWFPLTMWSIGTRSFAVSGRSRLERETAINELLDRGGFRVPKILHVSKNERLIFMEFVEGENLGNSIKRIAAASEIEKAEKELALITKVGETYAKVHALKVALGDTKPENIMVDTQGNLILLDFEQACRGGDKSWDIACFLYYSGHYIPLNGEPKGEAIARAFIDGYLRGGGNSGDVKCAGISKYTRVFSIFTLPGILRVMANTCKETEGPRCKKW